jgi:GNAT superfamily N-acetyltransferase
MDGSNEARGESIMSIRLITLQELDELGSDARAPWMDVFCERIRELPAAPLGRLLMAEAEGHPRALLAMRMRPDLESRGLRAIICALEVDPEFVDRGVGSRLVRFAEGIARIHGCQQVDVAADLEAWERGRCWVSLGYRDPGVGLCKRLESPLEGPSA